jgi:thioredoxin-related protein
MRTTLLTASLALFAAATLLAQQPASGGARTSLQPASSGTASVPASPRSTVVQPTPQRPAKSTATTPVAENRSANTPSATTPANTTPSTTATTRTRTRKPTATIPANTAARTGATATPKPVKPLKPAAEPVKVNWITIEEALEKSKTEKRKIFIDVYTDWCGWCKQMDASTFTDPTVVKYLNEKYYAVKFNAEQEKDIQYKEKTYKFKKNGDRGFHELAALWLNNRLSYPTVVVLDEDQNLIQPIPGYQEAPKMDAILHYFGTDNHKKTPWEKYERNYTRE